MVRRGPRGRFCVLNRRNYTRNGHVWNPMPDMELESLSGGGVRIFGRGVREKGGSDEPPEPPLVTGLSFDSRYSDRLNNK